MKKLISVVLLLFVFTAWWQWRTNRAEPVEGSSAEGATRILEHSQVRPDGSSEESDSVAEVEPTVQSPMNAEISVVDAYRGIQWKELAAGSQPVSGQATRRLGAFQVIASEEGQSSHGGQVRRYLLEAPGKYTAIVLNQEFEPGIDAEVATPSREVAYVANHVLAELNPEDEAVLADLDMAVVRQLRGSPVYIVESLSTEAGIETVEDVLDRLDRAGIAGVAEPDYLQYTSEWLEGEDEPASALIPVEGTEYFIDTAKHALVGPGVSDARNSTEYSMAGLERNEINQLFALPAGARIMTFDPPDGSPGSFRPEVRMHSFDITTLAALSSPFSSVYVNSAYTSGFPNNGTNYLRVLSSDQGVVITHKDGLPFDAISVDLSEYSTVINRAQTVVVKGTKAGGDTVTQSFRTDGVIDGTGPNADFENFQFNSSFMDVVKLEFSNPPYQIDNVAVLLKGQETPQPAPPGLPVIFQVDWNEDPVNGLTPVGGPRAPTSVNFGKSYVRNTFASLTERPLELTGEGGTGSLSYGQIRFDLSRNATRYELEFDVARTDGDALAVFFDGMGALVRFDIQNYIGIGAAQPTHFVMTADLITNKCTMTSNTGASRTITLSNPVDPKAIRISATDNDQDGGIAIDNVVIRAIGIDEPPTGFPDISTSPGGTLNFGTTPANTQRLATLRVFNHGNEDLDITSFATDSPRFTTDEAGPITIIPGGSRVIFLRYIPTDVGNHTATLSIASNDPDTPVKNIGLMGSATGIPAVSISPSVLNASVVAGTVGTEIYRISNTGTGPLNWRMISVDQGADIPDPVSVNDTLVATCWGLGNSESAGSDAGRAWNLSSGSSDVVVAVIDTGVDLDHADLVNSLVTNSNEIPGNGIDDDSNGFVDDIQGWDFSGDDNDPSDGRGHGTHVAGTVAAEGNNSLGVAGVAWSGAILPIQFLSERGSGYTSDAIESVNYARIRGARLINASWGGGGYSTLLQAAISSFCSVSDGLFVAAAGNRLSNNDVYPAYPASYSLDGIISVAASDRDDELAFFSNYGSTSVDLSAPGDYILSTYREGTYQILRGTSMAAPHVAGACALLMERNPDAGTDELRYFLLDWVDLTPGMNGIVASQGRLNVFQALKRVPKPWLHPVLSGGIVEPDEFQDVSLNVDARHLAPGDYSAQLAFSTNDPSNREVSLPINLEVFAQTGYNQWKRLHFSDNNLLQFSEQQQWVDIADGDSDGLSIIEEFLLSKSPDASDGSGALGIGYGSSPQFVFTTRSDHDGVEYEVCWSTTLVSDSWRSDLLDIQVLSIDVANGTVTYGATCLAPNTDTCFFKLVITNQAAP